MRKDIHNENIQHNHKKQRKKWGEGGDLSLPHPTGIWSMKASNDYAVLMENLLITNIL